MCTINVVSLYPSIPHDEGLGMLRKALDSRADRSVSTDSLMDLAEVVLKNNMFELNGRFYHQMRGTAIGTKCAPPYSLLFLADLEEQHVNRESKSKDGTRIPLVLTLHPALNEFHEILRKCENILLVDREHRRVFSGKLFVSFRRDKNFKDTLVRAKL